MKRSTKRHQRGEDVGEGGEEAEIPLKFSARTWALSVLVQVRESALRIWEEKSTGLNIPTLAYIFNTGAGVGEEGGIPRL